MGFFWDKEIPITLIIITEVVGLLCETFTSRLFRSFQVHLIVFL